MVRPLCSLRGAYLEFTKTPGLLRSLKPEEEDSRSRGVYFECPICVDKRSHGITLLFHHPETSPKTEPIERYTPLPDSLDRLTLIEKVKSQECSWTGWVHNGLVKWK